MILHKNSVSIFYQNNQSAIFQTKWDGKVFAFFKFTLKKLSYNFQIFLHIEKVGFDLSGWRKLTEKCLNFNDRSRIFNIWNSTKKEKDF